MATFSFDSYDSEKLAVFFLGKADAYLEAFEIIAQAEMEIAARSKDDIRRMDMWDLGFFLRRTLRARREEARVAKVRAAYAEKS
jgi:hypothetical protein